MVKTASPPLPPFGLLVERHGAELHAYARRLVDGDADDVLQDALLKALRAYPRLEHGRHLRAWLFRVVTTCAIDHVNRRRRRREVVVDAVPEVPEPPPSDGATFDGLLDGIPEGARRALVLRYVHDLPYSQVAARLGCSPEAARQRVSMAVRSLRERLR